MNIKTKFKLNQKVYIIFKEDNEPYVKILDDVIKQIVLDEDGIVYFCGKLCEEFREEEMVDAKDINALIPKIKELLGTNKKETND